MKPKKALGQNFLHSTSARTAIIEAAKLKMGDLALEIGPGKGFLTEGLLNTGAKVLAIEKDDNLVEFLREKFKQQLKSSQLELKHQDILEFDTSQIGHYKLIANIPYYLTGQIIRKFLTTENQPELAVLMLQKEVAARIIAKNGKESLLSIAVKAYGQPKLIKKVPAGAFFPPPKVDSAILSIEKIKKLENSNKFWEILKQGFAHKRKLLKSNLNCSTESLDKCKIKPKARAEELTLDQWQCLIQNQSNL